MQGAFDVTSIPIPSGYQSDYPDENVHVLRTGQVLSFDQAQVSSVI